MKKASTDPYAPRTCANCGKPDGHIVHAGGSTIATTLKDCSRCKLVCYCGKDCQAQHWKAGGHKEFCLSPEERRPEAPAQSSTAEVPLHSALSSTAANPHSIVTKPSLSAASNSKKTSASPSSSECANCGIYEGVDGSQLSSCARCHAVKYCGIECQRQHWRSGGHKKFCLTPGERRPRESLPSSGTGKASTEDECLCSICLERLDALYGPTTLLSCAHEFHTACVNGCTSLACQKSARCVAGSSEVDPKITLRKPHAGILLSRVRSTKDEGHGNICQLGKGKK